MNVVLPPNTSPSTFGIILNSLNQLEIVSPCCMASLNCSEECRERVRGSDVTRLSGSPYGTRPLECVNCESLYRGFSDCTRKLNTTVYRWVQWWTGLDNVTVNVS